MPFPENKKHISFSEIKTWKECAHRHRLLYIEGHQVYEASPYADFGTAVHDGVEKYLKTRILDLSSVESKIRTVWEKNAYESEEFKLSMKDQKWYKHLPVQAWIDMANIILNDVPEFLDSQFPEWEYVDAEMKLNEPIEGYDMSFKGFVDAIIRTPKNKSKGTYVYHILDWKTTGKGGWGGHRLPNGEWYSKRQDFNYLMQVGFYKKYVAKKLDIPLTSIRTGFVFLMRDSKPGKSLELFTVSAGPKFIDKTDNVVKSMLNSVKLGLYPKCFDSCKYCAFANTEHCNGHKEW